MARLNEVSSLQELDPSPVDESPVDVKKEEYFPTDGEEVQHADPESGTKASSSSLSLPLGLSGHSPTWYRKFLNTLLLISSTTAIMRISSPSANFLKKEQKLTVSLP